MSAIIKLNEAKDILEHLLNKMIQKITINYDFSLPMKKIFRNLII